MSTKSHCDFDGCNALGDQTHHEAPDQERVYRSPAGWTVVHTIGTSTAPNGQRTKHEYEICPIHSSSFIINLINNRGNGREIVEVYTIVEIPARKSK